MYPLRLLVEAKCYSGNRPVRIETPRNALGVLKDITENYFTYRDSGEDLQIQRFNYHCAVFSTSGYTKPAQHFAIAHQIFLIQYKHVPLMEPIADALLELKDSHFTGWREQQSLGQVRRAFRAMLENGHVDDRVFSERGMRLLREKVRPYVKKIDGSYFGMLQGRYPMHLVSNNEISPVLFRNTDEVTCRIVNRDGKTWAFTPSAVAPTGEGYFELEFDLPSEIARVVRNMRDQHEIAAFKRQAFSYLHLSGKIGGIHRMVRLTLDEDWLNQFLE